MSTSTRSSSSRTEAMAASPVDAAVCRYSRLAETSCSARDCSSEMSTLPLESSALTSSTSTICDRSRCSPRSTSRIRSRTLSADCGAPTGAGVRVSRPAMKAAPIRMTMPAVKASRAGREHEPRQPRPAAARAATARGVPTRLARTLARLRPPAHCRRTPSRAGASRSSPGTRRTWKGASRRGSHPRPASRRSSAEPGRRRSNAGSWT